MAFCHQWYFTIKSCQNIAGFEYFSTNVVKFCNKNGVIGSIHSVVPNFSKTIQIIFGKQFRFRLFWKMTKTLITQVTIQICRQIMQQFTQIIIFSLNDNYSTVVRAMNAVNGKCHFSGSSSSGTPEPIFKKFCTVDYVGDPTPHAKIWISRP